ncbi:MAG: glycosyl hydrolase [Verrucomicrobiota bacterium]
MNRRTSFIFATLLLTTLSVSANDLDVGFRNPPETTKPYCYWYWLNGDITADGLTKDLEAMAKVGIKQAMIGNIEGGGPVKMFSPEWYALTHHALKEASRVGVEIMMFNAPGWSQSGGPWIKPEQSMRRIDWNEVEAKGGQFSQMVRPANRQIQDVAVLAIPRKNTVSLHGSVPSGEDKGNSGVLRFRHSQPFKARALVVKGSVAAKLYALKDGKKELVTEIQPGGRNPETDFLPDGDRTYSFKEVTAQEFVLEPCNLPPAAVTLTSEPMVAQVIEKQMGRMHPNPSPTWESYKFKDSVEPDDASTVVHQKDILNLTDKLSTNGLLTCELPAGNWTVIYFGMVSTGKQNGPAPPEGTGLEVDKMSKALIEYHFNSMFGTMLKEITPEEKKAWKGVTIDSYEKGAQNWTDGFDKEFKKRTGYDPIKLLPVMTGRVIDSAKASDQFLWDLRRNVADMIGENYVGGLSAAAHKNGLTTWCENYGHWGFPGDFTIYGRYSDEIAGEFWVGGSLGTIECRAASSTAHIYGRRRVFAEAFTSGLDLGSHPYLIKRRGEEMFCEGINHFVLHVVAHQPRDGVPGKNPAFGTAFHRNTPWFNECRDWVRYLQRIHFMLQQGNPVADVAVYIGDFAPQMTGPANPVPAGYDYDFMGSDAILNNLNVVNGKWVVYDEKNRKRVAASYELLAIPECGYTRPQVFKRLEALKKAGGKTVQTSPVPVKSLQELGVAPIVSEATCTLRWKARQLDDGMMFFLSNFAKAGTFEATLRVSGKTPELFNPVTGEITKLARYSSVEGGTRISIHINDPSDSCFIVFREKTSAPSVVKAQLAGADVPPGGLHLFRDTNKSLAAESEKAGSYTLTMSDGTSRALVVEKDSQNFTIEGPWKSAKQDEKGYSVLQETTFALPAAFGKGQRVMLDLGQVHIMAKVKLNGKEYDTLWMPPFTLDVTDSVNPGENRLQVQVTSTSKEQPSLGTPVRLKTVSRGR